MPNNQKQENKQENDPSIEKEVVENENHKEKIENDEKIKTSEDYEKEITEMKDKFLRALADAKNNEMRMLKEKESAVKYALSGFIKDTILTMDHFYLSISNVKNESLENPEFKSFFDAINLTISELEKIMTKNNIKRINPLDEKFNPKEHEAVSQIPVEGKESGIVVQVLSAGYILEDRVIKPAIVVVSQ